MPKKEMYSRIVELMQENLARYEETSETYKSLSKAVADFTKLGLEKSHFDDEISVSHLNKVLQQFLNADKREISLKASEGGRSEKAANYEEILSEFGLIQEFPLPDFAGKTIAIFGANLVTMRARARWLAEEIKKNPDLPAPQIVFLTGDRAVFTHINEEREVLVNDIKSKLAIHSVNVDPEEIIKSATARAEEEIKNAIGSGKLKEVDAPKLKQAINPLIIMQEVNRVAPDSYVLEGLESVDLIDFKATTDLLKTALARRIYPNETSAAAVVAREELGLGEEALLPADELGKDYRATTGDNAKALLTEISKGKLSPKVILISSQPFCQRQHKDVLIQAEDPRWQGIKGCFEIAGFAKVDNRVNESTTLDVLARDVYTSNQLWQSRAKRNEAAENQSMSQQDVNVNNINPRGFSPLSNQQSSSKDVQQSL